jgi:hypothetical protein
LPPRDVAQLGQRTCFGSSPNKALCEAVNPQDRRVRSSSNQVVSSSPAASRTCLTRPARTTVLATAVTLAARVGMRPTLGEPPPRGQSPKGRDSRVGRLELWAVSRDAAWSRLWVRADLRFLATRADRSCPLHSPTYHSRVYPLCTAGFRARLVADAFGAPVLPDPGPCWPAGHGRPMQASSWNRLGAFATLDVRIQYQPYYGGLGVRGESGRSGRAWRAGSSDAACRRGGCRLDH